MVADYIALVKVGPPIITKVPQFTILGEDATRHFVRLFDEFCGHRAKPVPRAAAPLTELYDDERLRAEFGYTEGRPTEMRGGPYLALAHLPG